jgi:hypothetical protein
MQRLLLFMVLLFACSQAARAQKVDSIYFNLYTDSLKKGTHNYINVDGLLSNGRYLPLTGKQISFTASAGKFEGNSLWLEPDFAPEKVTLRATLKSDARIWKEVTIYVKKKADDEKLRTAEEILRDMNQAPTNTRKKGKKTKG